MGVGDTRRMTTNETPAPKVTIDADGRKWISHPRPAHIPAGKVWIPGTTIIMDTPTR